MSTNQQRVSGALAATAQFMVFEPGMYALDVTGVAPTLSDMGLVLPCIRLEFAPATPMRPGRATIVNPAEYGWLWPRADPTFIMVVGGRAGAVMTIYRANESTQAPEIRMREVQISIGGTAMRGAAAVPAHTPDDPAIVGAESGTTTLALVAHVTQMGDITKPDAGGWTGRRGGKLPVEGFSIVPTGAITSADIEYQGILGNNWSTPWFSGGEFCGSRGMMLPLLGFCVRLKGDAAVAFTCNYHGQFIGGETRGPCADGEPCQMGDAPLEAMQVVVRRREAVAEPLKPDERELPEQAGRSPAGRRRRS